MRVLCAEKPSVGRSYAAVVGANQKHDGYYEGNGWIVTWCIGHLVTLSYPEVYDESLKKWSLDPLPFLPDQYKYEVIGKTRDQFKVIKGILENLSPGDELMDGGDAGREGEYIQRLVYSKCKIKPGVKMTRLWIDSQTEEEIKKGIRNAKAASAYDLLSDAAYMRAIEDYALGINLSRAITLKYDNYFNSKINSGKHMPIAVGRVMTCVLGMIVAREREIRNFKPTDYFKIDAKHPQNGFTSHWKAEESSCLYGEEDLYNETGFKEKRVAEKLRALLDKDPRLFVEKTKKGVEKQNAPLLFNLAELQAECSKRFKISPDQTLSVAQALYEAKLTTYPRTDARVLSTAVAKEIDRNLKGLTKNPKLGKYAENILQGTAYKGVASSKYCDDAKITDHYAIIPTGEGDTSGLSELESAVYELICRRFLAIFFPAAEYAKNEVTLKHSCGEHFHASEKVLLKPGFKAVYGSTEKEEGESKEQVLSELTEGQSIPAEFQINTATTQPPKRYTSGSMILAMENAGKLIEDEALREEIKGSGIGTSATRAETIKKLVSNGYIALNKKTQVLTPELSGEVIVDIVHELVPSLLSPKMTANWEMGLRQIEEGKITQAKYRETFEKWLREAVEKVKAADAPEGEIFEKKVIGPCPLCGKDVVTTRKGGLMCSGYKKDDENSCKYGVPGMVSGRKLPEEAVMALYKGEETGLIKGFVSKDKKSKFDAKLKFVDGKLTFEFADTEPEVLGKCPNCGADIISGKFGAYCTNKCGFTCGKAYGKDLTSNQVKTLLAGKELTMKGLKSSSGKKYDMIIKSDGVEDFEFKKKDGTTSKGKRWKFATRFPEKKTG